MIVVFSNLYLKKEGSSGLDFKDRISYSYYTHSCTSFDVAFRHCQPFGLRKWV